jgi:hypothetical protein
MRNAKAVYALIGSLLLLSAGALAYFQRTKFKALKANPVSPGAVEGTPRSTANQQNSADIDAEQDVALHVANFLGGLTPGGNAEAAGRDRTYIVSYQVAFFRKTPTEKTPQESLTYQQLEARDLQGQAMPPYLYYGESVTGKYDAAHPESIAVRTTVEGNEVKGYIDASKLWLEPVVDRAESDRYMSLKNGTEVHAVPDPASPPVLRILQGEVVEAVGRLNFRGANWIKARFNAKERPRYGYILGSDVKALTFSSVNQSALNVEEVPQRIRHGKLMLSESDRQLLAQKGFYVETVPPLSSLSVDDMADSYREDGPQFFVTSDLYLHSFHLIFDRMLQDIEEKRFFPAVAKIAENLAKATENELTAAANSPAEIREALLDDLVYFSVAARLFKPDFAVSEVVKPDVEALVSPIQAGAGQLPSLKNFKGPANEDFTQYKVRGHYEKNETLKRYFRGMMWFGRNNFLLSDKKKTLAAILVPSIVEGAKEQRTFESLDALITYLIGRQDKYSLAGYRTVNRKVFGTESPNFSQLANNLDENVATFQKMTASELPAPQIVSVQTGLRLTQEERLRQTAAFKFLGQRYVLDALILNQLTSPSVGSDDNPRNLPTALDVMMLLGSKPATEMQQQSQKEHKWANYETQMAKVKTESEEQLAKRSTFYEQWLYAIRTLFLSTRSRQLFASVEPWQYKNLNAGLASWTELKHDTILYAEQSAAEMGEGEGFSIPPYRAPGPKGYVEPNPVFFKQLTETVDQLMGRLKSTNFATDEYLDKFTLFRELAHRAEAIAQKEVSGEAISAEDYEWIENTQWAFDRTLLLPRDIDIIDPSYLQMALVADVATDAVAGRVLEDGIGRPQKIVVVVKDAWGGTRLTVGYVYSWYEFDSTKRWNDSEWKRIIYNQEGGAKTVEETKPPAWYSVFLKSAAGVS